MNNIGDGVKILVPCVSAWFMILHAWEQVGSAELAQASWVVAQNGKLSIKRGALAW